MNEYQPVTAKYRLEEYRKDYMAEFWRAFKDSTPDNRITPNPRPLSDYAEPEDPVVTEFAEKLTGRYKTFDRPTIEHARRNVHYKKDQVVKLDRDYIESISRKLAKESFEDEDKIPMKMRKFDKIVLRQHPEGKEDNAIIWGEIQKEDYNYVTVRVEEELLPGVIHGVAIFREVDRNWDFMNIYISGLKGPIRKRGFDIKQYNALANKPGDSGDPNKVQRREYTPHLLYEEWVLMLRFTRPGDEFFTERDQIFFERRFWYRAKIDEYNISEKYRMADTALDLKMYGD